MADSSLPLPPGATLVAPPSSAAAVKLPPGATLVAPSDAAVQSDPLSRALNYRTGNKWVDAPLGFVQGLVKGGIQIAHEPQQLIENLVPGAKENSQQLAQATTGNPGPSDEQRKQLTTPNGIGQGTGKFVAQTAQYALPAGEVSEALKGASLLPKVAAQAGVGAGVSALQSGGDPTATVAGGVMGAAGEAIPAAISGVKALANSKVANLQNFADAFGATPTQKAVLSKALPTLAKDGVDPASSLPEMQDAIKGKLQGLTDQYNALDPAIKQREIPPDPVVQKLQQAQQQYMRRGVVTDEQGYSALQGEIAKVQDIAAANHGKLNIDDLVHLKQKANGRTNFQSLDHEKTLWENIGDAYRSAADQLAPETTPLNQDFATYKQLEGIADKNVAMGRSGVTRSGLQTVMDKSTGGTTGAAVGTAVGGAIGHAVGMPGTGAAVGATAGAVLWPKLGGTARQALQNYMDSGAFSQLSAARQGMLKRAAAVGDNATISKFLQRAPVTIVQDASQQP